MGLLTTPEGSFCAKCELLAVERLAQLSVLPEYMQPVERDQERLSGLGGAAWSQLSWISIESLLE